LRRTERAPKYRLTAAGSGVDADALAPLANVQKR